MHFERFETGDAVVVKVRGELTVEYAKGFQAALSEELQKSDRILLDLENVTEADISCLQLLCSAFGTAAKLSKQVSLGDNLPGQFVQFAIDAGYSRVRGFEAVSTGYAAMEEDNEQSRNDG
jgi:ABC-type transporter Mla MlaB component